MCPIRNWAAFSVAGDVYNGVLAEHLPRPAPFAVFLQERIPKRR